MTTRAGNMNGKIILTDQDNGAVGYSLLIQGTVEGLAVSNVSTGIVQVAIGRAVLLATRTSVTPNQKFLSHVEVTVAENVSITTGFVWLELIQSYINDGSTITATNGVGVARINSGSAYPSTNYLPLASITGGVITDARVFITGKAILQKGLTANSVKENNATGDEVLKTVGSGSSIISTETLRKKKADGNYEDIAWSTFKSDITSAIGQNRSYIAGEAISVNDFLIEESQYLYGFIANSTPVDNTIGNTASNTRISLRVIGNGISASTLKLAIKKLGAPVDNLVVRVETDNGSGLPSGTLAFANATSATAGTVFTTSYVDTTLTFSGAFTLTDGVVYHIVISRSAGLDVSNYYFVQGISRNTRSFQSSLYNTSYAAYTGTNMIYLSYAGAYSTVAVKTNATNADNVNYVGIAGATKTIGQSVVVAISGIQSAFTGLTTNAPYFLSNTPGAISSTPGTNLVPVGDAINTTTIFVKNFPKLAQDFNYLSVVGIGLGGNIFSPIIENKRKVYNYSASATSSSVGLGSSGIQISNDGITFTTINTINPPTNTSASIAFSGELPGKYFRLVANAGNSASCSATLI